MVRCPGKADSGGIKRFPHNQHETSARLYPMLQHLPSLRRFPGKAGLLRPRPDLRALP
jgi:hypothetical protein